MNLKKEYSLHKNKNKEKYPPFKTHTKKNKHTSFTKFNYPPPHPLRRLALMTELGLYRRVINTRKCSFKYVNCENG